jgi:hypothetical protein
MIRNGVLDNLGHTICITPQQSTALHPPARSPSPREQRQGILSLRLP